MDPETMLDTVGKGCEAATKFQEIIQKVFGPRWTKKQADADAYADERKLQTIRDNPDMEIVYTKDGMSARARTPEAFAYRAEQRMISNSIREQENLENVFEAAHYEIQQISGSSDKPVDDDWIVRFTNIAKDVSSEDMQRVWAKILAGEVGSPGSFSLRTLDVIRNLSQHEAATFQKLVPYIICANNDLFVTNESNIYEKYGITFEDLILLDECGLLSSAGLVNLTQTVNGVPGLIVHTKERLLALDKADNFPVKFTFGIHSLTSAGKELFQILESSPNEAYFLDFSEHIFKKSKGMSLSVHQVNSIFGKMVSYNKNVIRTFPQVKELPK